MEKQKRISINHDKTHHQASTTERANSEQINVGIRQNHSKSTVVGFGLKAKSQVKVDQSPILRKNPKSEQDPNHAYSEKFSSTLGISAPMKKYIESSAKNLNAN